MKPYFKLLIVLIIASFFLSGCAQPKAKSERPKLPSESTKASQETTGNSIKPAKKTIVVYYTDKDALFLHPFEFEISESSDRVEAVLEKLFEAPAPEGFLKTVPETMKKPKVKVEGDTAVVDFTSRDIEFYPKGSTGENLFLFSIVNSLVKSLGVKQVKFTVDGELRSVEGSNYDFSSQVFEFNPDIVASK
jgi:spore germination protein GerM